MLSGESVIQMLNAEPAGFILGLSSGRIAYMAVRDVQGRPAISVQFLRGSSSVTGTGLFGSLRNVLSSAAMRGDLAAARAGPSSRAGERTILTATMKGRLQIWDLHRGGHNNLKADVETLDNIVEAFMETDDSLPHLPIETFEVLDAVFAPRPLLEGDQMQIAEVGAPLVLLVSMGSKASTHYALVHVKVLEDGCEIGMVRHIRTYTTSVDRSAVAKPRLHLPNPALVAFVVLDRAVVVVSMAQQKASPESQLLGESNIIPAHYEDVIDFRKDSGVEIVGSGEEQPHDGTHNLEDTKSRKHRSRYPAALLLVRGAGVIRVAAINTSKLSSAAPQVVTAKSKLEQAVFFGAQDNNPLNFRGRSEITFSDDEISTAAIELSMEIINSTTSYLAQLPPTLGQHLADRAKALRTLALHLKTIDARLDRITRWSLLSIAEKIHSASRVWTLYDSQLQAKPIGQKRGLVDDIVLSIHEQYKTEPVPAAGELDRVRHYFMKDLYGFDLAIPWAYQVVKLHYKNGEKDEATIMSLLSEADDFVITALTAAFAFREENLALYGLQDEQLQNGVLVKNYKGLPQFWTSTNFIVQNLSKQNQLAGPLVLNNWQPESAPTPGISGAPSAQLVEKTRHDVPKLVDLCTTAATERFRWQMAQDDPQTVEAGELAEEASLKLRAEQLKEVAELNLVEEAINIAVKHKIYGSLAYLLIEELVAANAQVDHSIPDTEDFIKASRHCNRVEHRLQAYISQFGSEFAFALYTYYLERGELYALISDTTGKNVYLTEFLRSHPDLRRLAWINEVVVAKDFDRASKALLELADHQEADLWSKKTELSLGKLARLAGKKRTQTRGMTIAHGGSSELEPVNKQLAVLAIQDNLYLKVHPHINAAIDEMAEVDVAIDTFGIRGLDRPGKEFFPDVVSEKLTKLVRHEAMDAVELIDLLTLMNTLRSSDQSSLLNDQEFFMAIQALKSISNDDNDQQHVEQLIWRRCFLRDDWERVNNTDQRGDGEVLYRLQRTALYATLRACIKARKLPPSLLPASIMLTSSPGLFEKPSKLSPRSPTSLLGLSAKSPYTMDDEAQQRYQADLAAEEALLKHYIDKCQLEKWFTGIYEAAKHDVEDEVNRETENSVVMQEMASELDALEKTIAENGKAKALARLKSRPRYKAVMNASTSGSAFGRSLRITG